MLDDDRWGCAPSPDDDPFLGLVGMAFHLHLAEQYIGMAEKKLNLLVVYQQKVMNLRVQLRGLFSAIPTYQCKQLWWCTISP